MNRTTQFANHCSVLDIQAGFDERELKSAYRAAMVQWHPDKHQSDVELCEMALEKAKAINAAFEFLSELLEQGAIEPRSKQGDSGRPDSDTAYGDYQTQHLYRGKTYRTGFPDASVIEIFLKSSHIVSAAYNARDSILYIKFEGDTIYQYYDVPESTWRAFLAADSHGKYAHREIYYSYRSIRHQQA